MSDVIISPSVRSNSNGPGSFSSVDSYDSHIKLWNSLKKNNSSGIVNNNSTISNSTFNNISDINDKLNRLNKINNEQYNSLLSDYIFNQRAYNRSILDSVNKYNDTAYQRLVKDLKLAGLNPMLASFNVSPNRVSSVPYSNNIPNFSEYKNDFSAVFDYLLALLNNANKSDLLMLQNRLDKDYYKYTSEFTPYDNGRPGLASAMNYIGFIIKSLSPLVSLASAGISKKR